MTTILLKHKKCEESFISLVNISAKLVFPSMCKIFTNEESTLSLMAFSRIVMCLRPLVVLDLDQHTHALLSLYTLMGLPGMYMCLTPIS